MPLHRAHRAGLSVLRRPAHRRAAATVCCTKARAFKKPLACGKAARRVAGLAFSQSWLPPLGKPVRIAFARAQPGVPADRLRRPLNFNVGPGMRPTKILNDLITSATSAKAHFEVWWAQASEAKPHLVDVMNDHSDFFHASSDAHYTAFFVYLAHLFDKRADSSSIPTYLSAIAPTTDPLDRTLSLP